MSECLHYKKDFMHQQYLKESSLRIVLLIAKVVNSSNTTDKAPCHLMVQQYFSIYCFHLTNYF